MNNVMSMRMKFKKNQKGLTLIELLAVIVILGVIAAIAVPSIGGIISKSKTDADAQSEALIQNAAFLWATNTTHTADPTSVSLFVLASAGYLSSTSIQKQSASTTTFYTTVDISGTAGNYTAGTVNTGSAAPTS